MVVHRMEGAGMIDAQTLRMERIRVYPSDRARKPSLELVRQDVDSFGPIDGRDGWYWLYLRDGTHRVGLFSPEWAQAELTHHAEQGARVVAFNV